MTPAEMTPIAGSTMLSSVGHDGADLWVEFKGGALYRYTGAPASHVAAMLASPSAGAHFGQHIRGKFEHEKIVA
jgi:hypothetical protein